MEKNRFSGITEALTSRPARVAGALVVAGSALASTPQTEGKEPYVWQPDSVEHFEPVVIDDNELKVQEHVIVIPSPTVTPEPTPTEKPLSPTEKKIKKIKTEAREIYNFAKKSGSFSANVLDDLHDNLPFYLAASRKYGLDWVVLFVTQERESGGSDPNSVAFDSSHSNSDNQGSYQLSTSWDQKYRTEAFSGLEYTLKFEQRHKGDARDTATAARMLRMNIAKQIDNGHSYEEALRHAIFRYCFSEGETQLRMDKIAEYDNLFGDLAGIDFSK